MAIKPLNIFTFFDIQRFKQFSPQDAANWTASQAPSGKKKMAMYPSMGRKHITYMGTPQLIFGIPPRYIFRSIDFFYVVVGSTVIQIDRYYNQFILTNTDFNQTGGTLSFDFLPVVQVPTAGDPSANFQAVFCMLADGINCYVIDEVNKTMTTVTDPNTPLFPKYVVAFGNRFAVSSTNSTQFSLTQVNMGLIYKPNTLFTVAGLAVFAQESGIIREMGVLHNQLYIFTDFTTGIWSNTVSYFQNATFPWKKNTSYEWDYGMADPDSLDIDFGRMVWLARNRNGLITFMSSDGQMPKPISTQAVNVLLQNSMGDNLSPYLSQMTDGFLYQYEDTVFYRVSAGKSDMTDILDFMSTANAIEYNFSTESWNRCIEINGEKNLIQKHIFFNNKHIVTVEGQNALYEMAGNIYFNELQNTNPAIPYPFIAYPFRYELTTGIISEDDYSEFIDDYVEIDFVWGYETPVHTWNPYDNTVFLIGESPDMSGNPVYLVTEDGQSFLVQDGTNIPDLNSTIYNYLFKPHIELWISDDGGISFYSHDAAAFSQLGKYQWRMRWYQCGSSRNRAYKLVAVSPSPIVLLGAVRNTRRSSGGAN
jgi:hypothetical protein